MSRRGSFITRPSGTVGLRLIPPVYKSNMSLIAFVEDYLARYGVASTLVKTSDGAKARFVCNPWTIWTHQALHFPGTPTSCL